MCEILPWTTLSESLFLILDIIFLALIFYWATEPKWDAIFPNSLISAKYFSRFFEHETVS